MADQTIAAGCSTVVCNALISLQHGVAGLCGMAAHNLLISLQHGAGGVGPPYYVRGSGALRGAPDPCLQVEGWPAAGGGDGFPR